MKLAIYYPWLYLTSGAERTILEIARRSRHSVTVFTNRFEPDATFPELSRMDVRVQAEVPVERSLRGVTAAFTKILGQRLDLRGFDALLVVCEGLGDLAALKSGSVPAFCLCLTPLRIAFDPVYRRRYLSTRSWSHRLAVDVGSRVFRAVDRVAWRRYRHVFAISEEIRGRILAGRLAPADRISVLHPGIELSSFTPSSPSEKTFFVPGRIMWTKNLELAIQAFQAFRAGRADGAEWRLEIAGIVDRKSEPYLARLRALAGDDPAIEFRLHPTDEEMRESYRRCFATLFTAFNEDWGLVIIEAMASAKPVVAVDRGGPREIVRPERDGLLAAPDPESFASAMRRLADDLDLHRRLAAEAVRGAQRFCWPAFVRALDEAVERGAGPARSPGLVPAEAVEASS
jgi:glycosyltransferase involved in cell wall biosynthesis